MIDMSAAFDTVDHGIPLQRLSDDFGLCGPVHRWFQSYLSNRTSQVCVSGSVSTETQLKYGVPQGAVIGPQVFTYYFHTIGQIIRKHSIQYHIYADDVQLFLTFDSNLPGDSACALFKLECCVKELQTWMVANKLMMNPDKTEFFIASSAAHYKHLEHLIFIFDDVEIKSLLRVRKPSAYSLRSSTVTCLHVPKTRTLTGDRAFSSSAPRLWNNLPVMIKGTTTTVSFKKSLKRHLFPN